MRWVNGRPASADASTSQRRESVGPPQARPRPHSNSGENVRTPLKLARTRRDRAGQPRSPVGPSSRARSALGENVLQNAEVHHGGTGGHTEGLPLARAPTPLGRIPMIEERPIIAGGRVVWACRPSSRPGPGPTALRVPARAVREPPPRCLLAEPPPPQQAATRYAPTSSTITAHPPPHPGSPPPPPPPTAAHTRPPMSATSPSTSARPMPVPFVVRVSSRSPR